MPQYFKKCCPCFGTDLYDYDIARHGWICFSETVKEEGKRKLVVRE